MSAVLQKGASVAVVLIGIVQGIFIALRIGDGPLTLGLGALFGAAAGVLIAGWLRRRTRVADVVPPLVLYRDRLTLPATAVSEQQVELPFSEIEVISLVPGPRGNFLVGGGGSFFNYPTHIFVRPELVPTFVHALRTAVRAHGGTEAIARITTRTEDLGRFVGRKARVTYGIMGLLIAVFLVQRTMGATGFNADAMQVMARMGANVRSLVQQGEWWRLFTANFLHGFALHIIMNGLALVSLGQVIERIVGPSRFALIYLLSALGGSMASTLWSQGALSLGASTAVFGLLGSFGVLSLTHRRHMPPGVGQSLRWWLIILGINFSLPLVVSVVDGWAHFGGFIVGAIATAAVYPMKGRLQFSLHTSLGLRLAVYATVGVFLVAGVEGVREASSDRQYPGLVAELTRAQKPDGSEQELGSAETLNYEAWTTATSSSASRADLERAVTRAEMADAAAPGRSDILDTLATARYRVGDHAGAVSAELRSIDATNEDRPWWLDALAKLESVISDAGDQRAFHGSQLLRFSRALASQPAATAKAIEDNHITVQGEPGRIWLSVERGSETLGLVQVLLHNGSNTLVPSGELAERMQEGAFELVVLGSTTSAGSLAGQDPDWEFFPWDPEIEKLP